MRGSLVQPDRFFPGLQLFVREPLPLHFPDGVADDIEVVTWTGVQTIRELIGVTVQVLEAHEVERPVVATFEQRPEALDAVGVGCAVHILPGRVIDPIMVVGVHPPISGMTVRVKDAAGFDVMHNAGLKIITVGALDWESNHPAIAFSDAHQDLMRRYVDLAQEPVHETVMSVFTATAAPDTGLVRFDDTAQHWFLGLHRLADAVLQEPSGFVGDAELLRELQGGDALARGVHHVNGI